MTFMRLVLTSITLVYVMCLPVNLLVNLLVVLPVTSIFHVSTQEKPWLSWLRMTRKFFHLTHRLSIAQVQWFFKTDLVALD